MMTEQMINHDKDEFAELLSPDYRKIINFFSLSRHYMLVIVSRLTRYW